jgi:hypothetical protein
MCDCISTKKVVCDIQENGWIRGKDGIIIGRLCENNKFEDIKESDYSEYIKVVTGTIKKDEEYYYSWQANIAVCFQDLLPNVENIHDISNNAAKNFLNVLIR